MLLRHFVCPCGSKTREGPFRSRPEKRGADGLLQANQEGIRKELQPGLTWNPVSRPFPWPRSPRSIVQGFKRTIGITWGWYGLIHWQQSHIFKVNITWRSDDPHGWLSQQDLFLGPISIAMGHGWPSAANHVDHVLTFPTCFPISFCLMSWCDKLLWMLMFFLSIEQYSTGDYTIYTLYTLAMAIFSWSHGGFHQWYHNSWMAYNWKSQTKDGVSIVEKISFPLNGHMWVSIHGGYPKRLVCNGKSQTKTDDN